jgi:hypothetical protein
VEHTLKSLQRHQTFEHCQLVEGQLARPTLSQRDVLRIRTQSIRTQSSQVKRGGEKWVHTHMVMRQSQKLPMMPVPPGLNGSRRMMECVQLNLSAMRARGLDMEHASVYIDAGQSAHRAPSRVGCSPCITPNARIYASVVGRFLTSQECLSYQGIDLHDYPAWQGFSDAFLMDLAGNAFSSTVFLCVALCLFAHVD